MPRLLQDKEKTILYFIISIVIFSVAFNIVAVPVLTENKLLDSEIMAARSRLERYTRLLSRRDDIQNQYNRLFEQFGDVKRLQEGAPGFLSELEGLAKSANIRLQEIRPQGSTKDMDFAKETIVDLKTEGVFEDYLKFIYSIENSPLLLKIKKFQLKSKSTSQDLDGSFSISKIAILGEKR